MPVKEEEKWTLERWEAEKRKKENAAMAEEEAARAAAAAAAAEAARVEALSGVASFAEDAINAAERATGLDLDGDGDVGERGSAAAAAAEEEAAVAATALAEESVNASDEKGEVDDEKIASAGVGTSSFFDGLASYATDAINAVERATGLDLDGDGDIGEREGPDAPGLHWKEIFTRSPGMVELSNAKLSEALAAGKTTFTQYEIDCFQVEGLDWKTWIKAPNNTWFMPVKKEDLAGAETAAEKSKDEPELDPEVQAALAKAAADLEAANAIVTRWSKTDTRPWGRKLDNVKLSNAISNGQLTFTVGTLREYGLSGLDEDYFFIEAGGSWYELVSDTGTIICPICERTWVTIEANGRCSHSVIPGKEDLHRRNPPCPCSDEGLHIDIGDRQRAPLALLKEHMNQARRQRAQRDARRSRDSRSSRESLGGQESDSPHGGGKSARHKPRGGSSRQSSTRSQGFSRAWQGQMLGPSQSTPRSLIRNSITEALFRRFEVEYLNMRLGEDERMQNQLRRDCIKYDTEQHKQHGASLVAEEKAQLSRLGDRRKEVFDERDAQGREVQREHAAISKELDTRRVRYVKQAKRTVGETKLMQQRAQQNMEEVREANRKQGDEGKVEALVLERIRDEARQAHFDERKVRAHRVRDSVSPEVLSASAAIWAESRARAGSTLRAINEQGRQQRQADRHQHLQNALTFKAESLSWQANGRTIRAQIEEEKREQARMARERRQRSEEECRRAALEEMIARKEMHDAVAEAKHPEDDLVAGYVEFQQALLSVSHNHDKARRAAAKRATSARRQVRRQERSLFKSMMLQLQSRAGGGPTSPNSSSDVEVRI